MQKKQKIGFIKSFFPVKGDTIGVIIRKIIFILQKIYIDISIKFTKCWYTNSKSILDESITNGKDLICV